MSDDGTNEDDDEDYGDRDFADGTVTSVECSQSSAVSSLLVDSTRTRFQNR